MNKLLTGGAGYIGSHIIIELDKAGHSVVVVDNLANNLSDVIGAHQSGMIAESPIGIPNNLMPYITQTT